MAQVIDVSPRYSGIRRIVVVAVGCLIGLEFLTLFLGMRVLVSETKVAPGQQYIVDGWGDVGKAQQASLVCRYFTGRSIKPNVLWYSPNNVLGADECPFIAWPENVAP